MLNSFCSNFHGRALESAVFMRQLPKVLAIADKAAAACALHYHASLFQDTRLILISYQIHQVSLRNLRLYVSHVEAKNCDGLALCMLNNAIMLFEVQVHHAL